MIQLLFYFWLGCLQPGIPKGPLPAILLVLVRQTLRDGRNCPALREEPTRLVLLRFQERRQLFRNWKPRARVDGALRSGCDRVSGRPVPECLVLLGLYYVGHAPRVR